MPMTVSRMVSCAKARTGRPLGEVPYLARTARGVAFDGRHVDRDPTVLDPRGVNPQGIDLPARGHRPAAEIETRQMPRTHQSTLFNPARLKTGLVMRAQCLESHRRPLYQRYRQDMPVKVQFGDLTILRRRQIKNRAKIRSVAARVIDRTIIGGKNHESELTP